MESLNETGSLHVAEISGADRSALAEAESKTYRQLHGIGLSNVRDVVSRYDGDVSITESEKAYKIELLMYGKLC